LYGLDDIIDSGLVIIVEGEMDKLAMEEAGYTNCVSVPGAM
jgi:twinkle protein